MLSRIQDKIGGLFAGKSDGVGLEITPERLNLVQLGESNPPDFYRNFRD
ncbi:Phycocyanobilin lyase beta subunit [Crocosphaera watsonii WH 0401]|uniref:Phycocyanobilin lyase beta subunit n=1 Tax=Crocosphaera watsonii WH 0401 TaxID=555881 RepID=T2J7F2_CROWT|nr:Phycocyanobilin lyase beta subunit [Crocosphaera watsonii WH 0401]